MNDNKQNPILWFGVLIVILLISKSALLSRFKAEEAVAEETGTENSVIEETPTYQPLSEDVPSVEQAQITMTPDEFIVFVQHMCTTLPYEGEVYEDYIARTGYDSALFEHGAYGVGGCNGEVGIYVDDFEEEMDCVRRYSAADGWGSHIRFSIFIKDYSDAEYIYESLMPFMLTNPLLIPNTDNDSRGNSSWTYNSRYFLPTENGGEIVEIGGWNLLEMEKYEREDGGYTIFVEYPFKM